MLINDYLKLSMDITRKLAAIKLHDYLDIDSMYGQANLSIAQTVMGKTVQAASADLASAYYWLVLAGITHYYTDDDKFVEAVVIARQALPPVTPIPAHYPFMVATCWKNHHQPHIGAKQEASLALAWTVASITKYQSVNVLGVLRDRLINYTGLQPKIVGH